MGALLSLTLLMSWDISALTHVIYFPNDPSQTVGFLSGTLCFLRADL